MTPAMSRVALRPGSARLLCASQASRASRASRNPSPPLWARRAASSSGGPPPRRGRGGGGRIIGLLAVAAVAGAIVYTYPTVLRPQEAPGPQQAEVVFEKPRRQPVSKEDNRDLLSSQHLQVKRSWEEPGVYAWGANSGRVAAPDSADAVVRLPRRIAYFDGQILRDLKLDREFGAAVTEGGDLVQWGAAFSRTETTPVVTLKGKDLTKISLSRDRIIALASDGSVYSVPVSRADQKSGEKPSQSSWIPFWSSLSPLSYRTMQPSGLGWGERVVDVSSGLDHCLLLTSRGRVFSAASSTVDFPSKGQLGVAGLTWATRPAGPYDQPHEVATLKGFTAEKIATGDYHSLVLDSEGRVFSFGDNSSGQLGFEAAQDASGVDVPSLLPLTRLYAGSGLTPRVTSIAAGGGNSYFTVDASRVAAPATAPDESGTAKDVGRVVADTWACGEGIYGSLGTGRWTHISSAPTKIKALSGLCEYDEATSRVVPIRLRRVSAGSTHAAAVMDNATHLSTTGRTSDSDTNWGADVVWWGGNEYYQLGTGRRNNVSEPVYIGPLDGGRADAEKGRKGEVHRFQITPRKTVRLGEGVKGRKASVEQRVECGRYVTAVYSAT